MIRPSSLSFTANLMAKLQPSNEYVVTPAVLPKKKGERVMSCKDMEAFRFTAWKDRTQATLPHTPAILRAS